MALIRCNTSGGGAETADLLWTNNAPTTAKGAFTVSLDLSQYEALIIEARYSTSNDYRNRNYMHKDMSLNPQAAISASIARRGCTIYSNRVEFTTGTVAAGSSTSSAIPTRIWGIKHDVLDESAT